MKGELTQDELDELPECGGMGCREKIIDGKKFDVPFMRESFALWSDPDEICQVVDTRGVSWFLGWYEGVRYKRRL